MPRRINAAGLSHIRTFWPTYQDDTIGGHSVGYGRNNTRTRYVPTSKAISRAEEVLYYWMTEYGQDDERRLILSRYAMCMAAPKKVGSFRSFCEKNRSDSSDCRAAIKCSDY